MLETSTGNSIDRGFQGTQRDCKLEVVVHKSSRKSCHIVLKILPLRTRSGLLRGIYTKVKQPTKQSLLFSYNGDHSLILRLRFSYATHVYLSIDFRCSGTNTQRLSIVTSHKHCEYHGFCSLQVEPLAHVVGPVNPMPPHWAQCAAVPEEDPELAGLLGEGAGAGLEPEPDPGLEPEPLLEPLPELVDALH